MLMLILNIQMEMSTFILCPIYLNKCGCQFVCMFVCIEILGPPRLQGESCSMFFNVKSKKLSGKLPEDVF